MKISPCCFAGLFGVILLFEAIGGAYIFSTIQNLERQFQISSKLSGFIVSASASHIHKNFQKSQLSLDEINQIKRGERYGERPVESLGALNFTASGNKAYAAILLSISRKIFEKNPFMFNFTFNYIKSN